MKLKSREINIFSMSALDLFASGMGAFILLAVISLPFFGNVSKIPAPAPQTCPEMKVCPPPSVPKPDPVPVPKPTPSGFQKMQTLDLVVVLDVTGSMGQEINGLRAEIGNIARIIEMLSDSAAMRIVAFGDKNFDRPVSEFPLTLTKDIAVLKSYLEQVNLNLGIGRGFNPGDNGESVYAGFEAALDTKWRSEAQRRVIFIITDDEAHSGEARPLMTKVQRFANEKYSVSVRYSGDEKHEKEFYQGLAKAGLGNYLDISNGSLTAALLIALMPK
ncbi:vWA domain-containing protein [Aliiglaciecola lipolytica]|uniref:vWA domain-containing protein n=1 Tax=Aliiglaciecola lipolytica TaxID=477689 RepID=UPI001C0823F7|nr:vWA domain-containing protein [Aliiglaciecola lipolytica]MBU2876789.1 VWA domain-containing protein [Aliiglaciecola lipolytica]